MPRTKWLLREPVADASARLFCFPYAGVGASMYARWPRRIGPAEVVLLQPPGRENRMREPHLDTFEAFAEQAADAIRPYLDRPFAFYGHCAGSLPAFATALHLARTGAPVPDQVYVSSQAAPHQCPRDRYLTLDEAALRAELSELTVALGGNGAGHDALIDLALVTLTGDLEPSRRYSLPAPVRIPSPVTVLQWRDDPEVSADEMAGWAEYHDEARVVEIDGGHYAFAQAPPALMDLLAADLSLAVQRGAAAGRPA